MQGLLRRLESRTLSARFAASAQARFTRPNPGLDMAKEMLEDSDSAAAQATPSKPVSKEAKRKQTMDDVLRQVLDEALVARDRGENPDMDFVYKKTQDRMYEAEHGRPPPSRGTNHLNYIPPEPRTDIRRLVPCTLFDDDPWPVVAAQPADVEAGSAVEEVLETERSPVADFADAADELAFWERRYLHFLRSHSLGLRKSLPLLVEHYKALTHRVLRAENRFVAARDKAVGKGNKIEPAANAAIEERVDRIRKMYVETHRSLTQATYDPTNMNRSFTGKILVMSAEEFEDWLSQDKAQWNDVMSAFTDDAAPHQ